MEDSYDSCPYKSKDTRCEGLKGKILILDERSVKSCFLL